MAMKRARFIAVVMVILAEACFAQSPHQVEVVAEVSLTNQTGTTGGTLYTPKETGIFRVNLYVQCTKGDPQDKEDLNPVFAWKDDNPGTEQLRLEPLPDQVAGLPFTFIYIIKDIGGAPIEWQVDTMTGDTAVYEVYLALERIGPKVQ
jgi:hypothetical protein